MCRCACVLAKCPQQRLMPWPQYPLSLYQGLAICLASLDRKMADSKGFDMFKRLRK